MARGVGESYDRLAELLSTESTGSRPISKPQGEGEAS
jgi:hypothetical protein